MSSQRELYMHSAPRLPFRVLGSTAGTVSAPGMVPFALFMSLSLYRRVQMAEVGSTHVLCVSTGSPEQALAKFPRIPLRDLCASIQGCVQGGPEPLAGVLLRQKALAYLPHDLQWGPCLTHPRPSGGTSNPRMQDLLVEAGILQKRFLRLPLVCSPKLAGS